MCRVVETNAVASPSRCAALPLVMAVPLALRRGRCRHFLPASPMVPVPLLLSSAGIEFGERSSRCSCRSGGERRQVTVSESHRKVTSYGDSVKRADRTQKAP